MLVLTDEPVEPAGPSVSLKHSNAYLNILIALIAVIGILIAGYPMTAQWFTAKQRAGAVSGYVEEMERVNSEDRVALLDAARAYNAAMPQVLLSDPYGLKEAGSGIGGAWESYQQQLRVNGSEIIGRISVPSISTSLPILHGTDDQTLARGAGHLFGSSLPVGGEGTHSVLTAHTAFTRAHLFDDLDKVEIGDEFFINVAGETLAYRVDQIEIVLPEEIASLQLVPGDDYVTLVTCTPRTVNTHRLLVRGERVVLEATVHGPEAVAGEVETAGFPWWVLWVGGGVMLIGCLAIAVTKPSLVQLVLVRLRRIGTSQRLEHERSSPQ